MFIRAPRSEKELTYDDALLYCTFCNHDGFNNWRLPTKEEYHNTHGIYGWYLDDQAQGKFTVTPVRSIDN